MMIELIERIEALEGPDREVDRLVGRAAGWRHVPSGKYDWMKPSGMYCTIGLPPFTASLDAAMTLVPEGWSGLLGFRGTHDYIEERGHAHIQTIVGEKEAYAEASTPALALCAAALRARLQEDKA